MAEKLQGLTEKEARKRLEQYGPNELTKKKEASDLKFLLDQFKSPLVYILVFAGLVTLFLREWTDAAVIFAAVLMNTVLGFFQERKAQKALAALRSFLVSQAKVIRNGKRKMIPTRDLVPGDLVILEIGNRIPADGVLVEATDISVNEAILTGESMPVKKQVAVKHSRGGVAPAAHRGSELVYMGTEVVTGIGQMKVTATGVKTAMGEIGKSVAELVEERTPLQIQLDQLGKILAVVVGLTAFFIFIFGEILGYEPVEMFTTSVAIAVAAIPEGLVVTLTVILSLGMQRILRRKALVRKLLAAETLGSVSVICCDKTGTLTEGEMKVVGYETEKLKNQETKKLLVKAAILCNDLRDPLEMAMMKFAERELENPKTEKLKNNYPRLDEIPFSPEYKYIATLHKGGLLFVSGAPEVILKKSRITNHESRTWRKRFEEYGEKGLRLVGFAYRKISNQQSAVSNRDIKNLNWLGILLFEDPVRSGLAVALKECQKAGIEVKVITGDYRATAAAVLKKLAIANGELQDYQVMEGEELEKISERELKKRIKEILLFARVDPQQKLKIVQVLQEEGQVVAMTGDGVNDAPAIKKADIGIVVGEGSDVARETADMVLLNSSFTTIVAAIEEGRAIFENIKKVVLYLLSDSFTEVILVAGSMILGLPLPLTAAQILWVNLVEDGLPDIALAFEPKEKDLMRERPRAKKTPILDLEMKVLIFIIGLFTDLTLLTLLYLLTKGLFHLHHIQTIIFAGLAIDSLFYVFSCRSLRKTFFHEHPFENKILNLAVIFSFVLLFLAIYLPFFQRFLGTHPLEAKEWLLVLAIGIFNITAIEITKWVFIARRKSG